MDASQTSLPTGTRDISLKASVSSNDESASRADGSGGLAGRWAYLRDFWELTKPEITFLVTLSALAGFLLASQHRLDAITLFHTLLGTALTAGGSGVLNHFYEREIDREMRRTNDRPLPARRVNSHAALLFGCALVLTGVFQLLTFTNGLTAALSVVTVVLYLAVYTPLKRVTTYNTLIGCFPGALPALGGWTAATGSIDLGGWLIFGMLFTWQMPHFLALAWMYRNDYARGGFRMLPVTDPAGHATARQTLLFTVLLVTISILPTVFDLTGWVYMTGVLVLGGYFLRPAVQFFRSRTNRAAKRVLSASIVYVPALVGLIALDQIFVV